MKLGNAGWLATLLSEVVAENRPERAPQTLEGLHPAASGRARARAYLRRAMREGGLLYGTPAFPAAPVPDLAPQGVLFLSVLRTLARIALDVADIVGAPAGPRQEQLLVLLAVLAGQVEEAEEIDQWLARVAREPLPRRLWTQLEAALGRRALPLSGEPAFGLVLHNAAVFADAQLVGRQALDYFARGKLLPDGARRRLQLAARQKVLLVEVLTALASVERPPTFSTRRVIQRQIAALGLPSKLASALRAKVKEAFEQRPALDVVARGVRSRELRRFVLEQVRLAALVDGRLSEQELAFLRELALALGVGQEELSRIQLEVAEFYTQHRSVVDVFKLSPRAEVMGEKLVGSIQESLEKNFHRLMIEVRETGELSVLLAKAARGQKLTEIEKGKMRAQLIDVAKAIPALAIFAAPGGLFLLVALAKVLPFNLLPSAFQDKPAKQARR